MYKLPIKFIKKHPNAVIPEKKSLEAACFDLTCTEIEQIDEDKTTVKFGICSSIPKGFKIVLVPRSSLTHSGWIMANSPGQIDSDYRGEWMIKFDAIPTHHFEYIRYADGTTNDYGFQYPKFPYKVGDRVAQCYLEKVTNMEFMEVESLDETERGEGGFGSTNIEVDDIDAETDINIIS